MWKTMALAMSLLLVLGGCAPGNDTREQTQRPEDAAEASDAQDKTATLDDIEASLTRLAAEIAAYSARERQQALAAARAELKEIDATIDDMAQQAEIHSQELAEQVQDQRAEILEVLKSKRAEVAEWSDRFTEDSAQAWDEVQNGFGTALVELGRSLEEARKVFQEPAPPDDTGDDSGS